ncbi:MAG TPA: AAA family ATPase [Roseiflexaceae bacterium]|nr:AAA family ATPase [Roseiflexaceae bacterium]
MAIEPYRPQQPQYRDELDRELDQKIDQAFYRWPWKVRRLIWRTFLVLGAIWLLSKILPAAGSFLFTSDMGAVIMQVLVMGSYLFFFIGFQFFLMFYFMGRTRIYWLKPGETGISFKDYKGNPEVLEAASRIVTLLKGAKEFKDMGGEVTRGVLLVGPPGTGKSYMAQAISTEAGVPFGYLSAPSLTSAWMGMGNMKVMLLYRKARKLAREYGACVLFIDEIDAIGMARSSNMAGAKVGYEGHGTDQTGGLRSMMMGMGGGAGSGLLNELLIQMDPPPHEQSFVGKIMRFFGLRNKKKAEMPPVLTMGATNLSETLDAALLRPGRFDRKIAVDLPDADGRKEIIEYYLAKVKHEPMPMDRMMSDTIGYTPVAVKFVINEAVIHAHFDGRKAINYWVFTLAGEMHEGGERQPVRIMSSEARRRIAYHEAGHAYAMVKLYKPDKARLNKVTIIRHGGALGMAAPKPVEETYTSTKEEQLVDIQVSLASRAAEEIFLNVQMTGVTGDLRQATIRAALIVGAFGMDNSFVSYLPMGYDGLLRAAAGGELKTRVDRILNEEYAKVKALIDNNKEAVIAIAEALILRNELTDIDVNEILARVEAEHPFVSESEAKIQQQPFGFGTARALPEPTTISRRRSADTPQRPESAPVPSAQKPIAEQPGEESR